MSTHKMTLIWTIDDRQNSYIVNSGRDVLVGRRLEADIVLPDPSVSREHARIYFDDGHFHLRNLSRVNPVHVKSSSHDENPRTLAPEETILIEADMLLCIGPVQLTVKAIELVERKALTNRCSACGHLAPTHASVCPSCGKPMASGRGHYVDVE